MFLNLHLTDPLLMYPYFLMYRLFLKYYLLLNRLKHHLNHLFRLNLPFQMFLNRQKLLLPHLSRYYRLIQSYHLNLLLPQLALPQ